MDLTIIFILLCSVVLFLLYWYKQSNYWKDLNVPGPKPIPIVGNFARFIFGQTSLIEAIERIYKSWKLPYIGVFIGVSPYLLIRDPDLVKRILIKDFNVFQSRGIHVPEHDDSLQSNIFTLEGHRWKVLRSKLTPLFTSGKLRHMVNLAAECAENFEKYLIENVKKNYVIEIRDAAAKFTIDVFGSTTFGIEMSALSTEESEFRKIGKKIFESNKIQLIKIIMAEILPSKMILFVENFTADKLFNYFRNIIRQTINYRKENNIIRNDLIDLLIDLKNRKDELDIKITDNILTAQAFLFFAAGFETSATTISFALLELAYAPEHQETLREEILKSLETHNGKNTYESINQMKFMTMVVQETLRKHPPGAMLKRQSTSPWTIPNTDVTLPTGTTVIIPTYSFHYDPTYFPNPEDFNPFRFDDETLDKHRMTFLPFGSGPKNCIGERFAYYQIKLGIISILKNFIVKPSKLSTLKYKIDKHSVILRVKGGVHLLLEPYQANKNRI